MNKKYFLLLLFLFASQNFAKVFNTSSALEIKEALKSVQPGDTIIMLNGNWIDQEIKFAANGTAEKPVLLLAETPGKVILSGSSILRIAGDYLVVDGLYFKDGALLKGAVIEFRDGTKKLSNHSRLTNTVIENYNAADKDTDYKWVSLYGTNNRVDHCRFENKTHSGCLLVVWLDETPDYHLIDSNYFGYRPPLGYNGGEIIRVGTSHWSMYNSFTTVENNYFEKCNGEREIISNKSCGNVYSGNTFVECEGTLTLRHGNKTIVENNFFFGNGKPLTGGVRIIGEDQVVINNYFSDLTGYNAWAALPMMNGVPDSPLNRYFQVKNALVAGNIFINNKFNLVIGVGADEELSLPPENSKILSNIFYKSSNPFIIKITEPQNFTWEGNVFYGSETGINQPQDEDPELEKDEQGIFRMGEDFAAKYKPAEILLNPLTQWQIKLWSWTNPINKKDAGPHWAIE